MRYFVGFLIAIGLIVLVFILILRAFSGGPKQQHIDLNSYATTDAVVQLTIDGPINDEAEHRQVKIVVSRSQNTLQVLQGYQGSVAVDQTFDSNQDAYTNFLHALNIAGFTTGNTNPTLKDYRGYCPTGNRYIYELISGGDTVQQWWHTSCDQGNYKGNAGVTNGLFKAQIPGYSKTVSPFGLY